MPASLEGFVRVTTIKGKCSLEDGMVVVAQCCNDISQEDLESLVLFAFLCRGPLLCKVLWSIGESAAVFGDIFYGSKSNI